MKCRCVSRRISMSFLTTLRKPRRPRETGESARNRRAERLRVNSLASRPGRSRFAARVRRFATRGCERGGLARWAREVTSPSAWPTVAGVLADCLFVHRAGLWHKRPLAQSPSGQNTETRERQRTFRNRRAARTMSPAEHVESSVAALSKRPVNGLPARSLHPTLGAD